LNIECLYANLTDDCSSNVIYSSITETDTRIFNFLVLLDSTSNNNVIYDLFTNDDLEKDGNCPNCAVTSYSVVESIDNLQLDFSNGYLDISVPQYIPYSYRFTIRGSTDDGAFEDSDQIMINVGEIQVQKL
jgi:hypothetical protein